MPRRFQQRAPSARERAPPRARAPAPRTAGSRPRRDPCGPHSPRPQRHAGDAREIARPPRSCAAFLDAHERVRARTGRRVGRRSSTTKSSGTCGSGSREQRRAGRRARSCAGARGTGRGARARRVLARRIAHVLREAVARVARVELAHARVTVHLGDDRGRRDRAVVRVAPDRCVRRRDLGHRVRVDQHVVGRSASADARRVACHEAARSTLMRSTSSSESSATRHGQRLAADLGVEALALARAVSCFESSRPGSCTRAGRTTAAATSGPAIGPTPTSSTPATKAQPVRSSARRSGNRRETRRDSAARARRRSMRAASSCAPRRGRRAASMRSQRASRARRQRDGELRAQLGERAHGRDRARRLAHASSASRAERCARARARGAAARAGARAPRISRW